MIINFASFLRRTGNLRCCMTISITLCWMAFTLSVSGATNIVRMVNFAFQPQSLTIQVGDTVLWTNTTTTGHNVVSDSSPAAWPASALFTRPGTFPVTFTQPGTYGYFCSPHRSFGMTGTIVVQAAANQAPVVSLTNPAPGLTLAAPANVTLGASASDPDGTVASVEFFSGQTSLGSSSASPYSFTATDLPAGSYSFTATATDNLGLSTTSDAVALSVVTPGPISFDSNLAIVNGTFALRLTVTPGLKYAIDAAGDLSGWQTLTNFVATSSVMQFAFPVNGIERRFFRAKLLPNP